MKTNNNNQSTLEKVPTEIPGFDTIAHGGLPKGRTTLIAGASGSGKTIFAMQYLIGGIEKHNEPGVFVTFEESPKGIIRNMKGFGWNIQNHIDEGKLLFVDASPSDEEVVELGDFDLEAFLVRIVNAVDKINAQRVAIDSISALFPRYNNQPVIRRELHKISKKLKDKGVTTVLTAEKVGGGHGQIARFGVEEFVSDNVVVLYNRLDKLKKDRRRSVEILKFRGTSHETLDTPLLVLSRGINVFPRPTPTYRGHKSSTEKISLGISKLDEMFFGGVFKNSTTLVTGASGTGKTVSALSFIMEGARNGQQGMFIAFEESEAQLYRNAESFGWDLRGKVEDGTIKLFNSIPEELKPEEHFRHIRNTVEESNLERFAIDSLSALQRIYSEEKFREFVIGLNSYLKSKNITSYFTNTTNSLLNISKITETHLSTSTDNIILLKYIELDGQMKRAVAVIKSRGSDHDKVLREYIIDNSGMHVKTPFYGVENLMGGSGRRVTMPPKDVINQMNEIDDLRRKYIEGNIPIDEYNRRVQELRESLDNMQRENLK